MKKAIILGAAAIAAYVIWSRRSSTPAASTPSPASVTDTSTTNNAARVAPAFSAQATSLDASGIGSLYTTAQASWGSTPAASTQAAAAAPTVDRAAVFRAQGLVEAPWAPGNYVSASEAAGYQQALATRAANDAATAALGLFA